MSQSKPITRRQFLLWGSSAAVAGLCGGAYLVSSCPLSDSGVCVGPCSAFLDLNGDGLCDRVEKNKQTGQAQPTTPVTTITCPFGLVNDPYPGQCGRYTDHNGDGLCDLSEVAQAAPVVQPTAAITTTACPFGLVNDPYPGQCGRYTDRNGDGLCDFSQVAQADPSAEPTPTEGKKTTAPKQYRNRSRQRQP